MAIKAYPEIKENLKEVFIMGGNSQGLMIAFENSKLKYFSIGFVVVGKGNSLKGSEFNFYKDPEAAHIVLNSLNCPITIVPFECGLEDSISIPLVRHTT